jgi:hypothetical protein
MAKRRESCEAKTTFKIFHARDNKGREYRVGHEMTARREGKQIVGYDHRYTLINGVELTCTENGVAATE